VPVWLVGVLGGAGAAALFAVAWWSSGRQAPSEVGDPRRGTLSPEESFRMESRRARFDQTGGPGA
jgi:hypothetical protein